MYEYIYKDCQLSVIKKFKGTRNDQFNYRSKLFIIKI